jgi:hypothetical protein
MDCIDMNENVKHLKYLVEVESPGEDFRTSFFFRDDGNEHTTMLYNIPLRSQGFEFFQIVAILFCSVLNIFFLCTVK